MSNASVYEKWSREMLIERLVTLEHGPKPQIERTATTKQLSSTKQFDFSSHPRRKIALKFCYSGWEYGGLAYQNIPGNFPAVENVLFDALTKAHLIDSEAGFDGCGWEKCGRTDRGVSAAGQVISLWVRSALQNDEPVENPTSANLPGAEENIVASTTSMSKGKQKVRNNQHRFEHDYLSILNRLLPSTIRVIAWSPVSPTFSARFSCTYRHYKYFFSPQNLDIPRMRNAADRLIGDHDFRNLCKLDPQKQITNFKRKVLRADIEDIHKTSDGSTGLCVFNLVGSAFLYHQVRHIMAVLFLVGAGLEHPSVVSSLMNTEPGSEAPADGEPDYEVINRKPEYQMADALPLLLWECGYPESELKWRTTGRQDDGELASGGELHHQMQSIHDRSRIYALLNAHFLAAVSRHHPPSPPVFPIPSDKNGAMDPSLLGQTMNIDLGGGTYKRSSKYTPLVKRNRLDAVEVTNERWRMGKGFRRDERRRVAEDVVNDGNE